MKPAVFIDRDGTINPDPGYIADKKLFELYDDVAASMSKLRQAGYYLILLTNQSGLSRGIIRLEQLADIHEKMQNLLKPFDAKFDAIYYCPHHPDYVYDDGVSSCDCRKPKIGMVKKARHDFEIDMSASFMIGDRLSDMQMAENASLMPILIRSKCSDKYTYFDDFTKAASFILSYKG